MANAVLDRRDENSYSYIYTPRRASYTLNRYRPQTIIPRQCETPVLKNGSVRLRQRGKLIRYLCLPHFTLIGDKYSSCVQGQWENPVPMCIKPGCPVVSPPENGFTVVDKNGALTMLFCRPGYSVAGSQETFCNGTAWDRSLGSCRETQASPAMSCDFEVSSICGWEPDPTHDFEWTRKNGYTSVKQTQTGPQHDHSVGIPLEGHFMLATFANQSPNSVARLLSPLYPASASKDACFRFYYHMYGAITGALRIYIKPESLTLAEMMESSKYLYMEKNGSYENAWLESVFEIDEYDQDFQIIIEATTVRTTRSNIAIDDVALLSGADCANEEFKSTAVTPEEGGIFDAQSCVNRCQETSTYARYVTEPTLLSSNTIVNTLQCDCFDGCVDMKSCCLDYQSVCVFDFSTFSTDTEFVTEVATVTNALLRTTSVLSTSSSTVSTPSTPSTSTLKTTLTPVPTTTVIQTTKIIPTTKTIPTTTSKPISTTKITPTTKTVPTTKTIPTTRVIPTIRTIPTTKTNPTSKTTPITKVITPTTSIPKRPTKPTVQNTLPKITSTSKTPMSMVTTPTATKKIVTVLPTTHRVPVVPTGKYTKEVTEGKPTNGNNDEWHALNDPTDTDPLPTNLINVFGILLLIIATIVALSIMSFKFYQYHQKRRFNYKSKSKRYSEDASDEVRFLTADEQLDFTMQTEDCYR
ncbi:uncharacterized protein LOC119081600 [Bradysia coprophila]|uniref:uncharacterized protein LOC119081600 n=1 Tax=Bradysia coprophila TaxID=38358 RepID=UPI00187DCB6D|nr:uncharacterized protein LOC119081600 [Bradysia coprophila]